MPRYLLLAMNGSTGGPEAEAALNQWYEQDHLPGFRSIPGIRTARRYKVMRGKVPGQENLWPYVAAYEIETDDLAGVMAQVGAKLSDFHPALDRERSAHLMAIQVAGDE